MKKKILLYILIPLLAAAAAAGYLLFKKAGPDFIFLITLDTTRADFIKYTRQDNRLTPNLARLAEEGVRFVNTFSLIPITLPSHAAMFYSLPPHVLKIYNNGQPKKVSYPSAAQLLKSKGFYTAAVVSLGVLKAEFGLGKGFDDYIENFRQYFWYKNAAEVNRDAMELIRRKKDEKKAFFWLHYSDPHEPYYPPYFAGSFRMTLNDSVVFQARSSEQPLVKLDLELQPGKNILWLKSQPPKETNRKKIEVGFYTYRNFSIKSLKNPDDLKVVKPKRWSEVTARGKVNVYSRKQESRLVLINKSKEKIPVNIKFLYRMLERPASRKSLYRKEIRYMDKQLGKLFAFLKEQGVYEKSAFIIMGDHGEGLGEYDRHYGHIHYLYKLYSRVPLIMFGKGVKDRGKKLDLVSNLNIAPTLLHLAGIEKPKSMRGESLLRPITHKRLLLETYSPEAYFDVFSVLEFPYQVVFSPGVSGEKKIEYFDLRPDEGGVFGLKNIKESMPDKKLKGQLLDAVLKISRIITATKGKATKVSARHREILESLGYL
ncbi:MAG: sulfatase [Candidatus Aminicenantes bacterium]|nr:sulfatase [Candidatus Aminicenantes bacterium]